MPGTVSSTDDIRARRRRRLAVSAMLARGSGLAATVVAVFDWSRRPPGTPHTTELVVGGLVATLLMLVALVASALAFRRAAHPSYTGVRTLEGVLDCGVIIAAVAFFSAVNHTTSWPILVIPILLAGYARHTAGAVGMWLLTAGSYAVVPWLLTGRPPADLAMAASLLLVVSIAAGTQGSAFARQVQELHATRAELSHLASHDALTGLANRSLLAEHAADRAGERVAVLVLDLNHFKRVNDDLGHAAGDELLRTVARRLTSCIGPRDLASRVGGDEFVVLLAGVTEEQAAAVAARIRRALAEPVRLGGVAVPVHAGIGVACREPGAGPDLRAMVDEADRAMYRDKQASRRTPARASAEFAAR